MAACLSGNILVSVDIITLCWIWLLTSQSGQLSLAIHLWVSIVNTSKSWVVNRHSTWYTLWSCGIDWFWLRDTGTQVVVIIRYHAAQEKTLHFHVLDSVIVSYWWIDWLFDGLNYSSRSRMSWCYNVLGAVASTAVKLKLRECLLNKSQRELSNISNSPPEFRQWLVVLALSQP